MHAQLINDGSGVFVESIEAATHTFPSARRSPPPTQQNTIRQPAWGTPTGALKPHGRAKSEIVGDLACPSNL